jgi:hypothetical protein
MTGGDYCGSMTRGISTVRRGARFAAVRIHNFYVPAGGDEPESGDQPEIRATSSTSSRRCAAFRRGAADVGHSGRRSQHRAAGNRCLVAQAALKVVSHTPVETENAEDLRKAGGWVDLMRTHIPPEEKIFTWWSYRARDWDSRPWTAARSCLGIGRPGAGFSERVDGAARGARLGKTFRPCSGDGAFRFLRPADLPERSGQNALAPRRLSQQSGLKSGPGRH